MKAEHVFARRSGGYTLIELMIVLVVIAVLASIALPTYTKHVLQSRRSEARAAIEEIRTLEYEFFQNYKRFGSRTEIDYPLKPFGGYYQVNITTPSALKFQAFATAQGRQLKDTDCEVFGITSVGSLVAYKKSGVLNSDCW